MLLSVMQVRVLCFGVLKDWFGTADTQVALFEGDTVAALLKQLNSSRSGAALPPDWQRGIAVSVNSEYAHADQVLREGDEVGLLPPVSGGCAAPQTVALTREPIDAEALIAAAKGGEDGAVVVFDGIVRNNTRGRQTLYLDYEAYDDMALKQVEQLAADARGRFGIRHVTIVHRLGRLTVGETSVIIVVSSAHRAAAFEASRWLIDTLKKTVPIWKKETFADGVVWAPGEPFPTGIALDAEAAHEA